MKKKNSLHSLLIMGFIVFSCLIAGPQTAKAGFIETVEDILNAVHTIDPATDLPSGSDVEGARNLLDCIGGGTDVGICLGNYGGNLDNYHLQKVIDLYVAVKNDDFWGVIGVVGEEAICIVADIMTAGVGGSLCGLIEDIIKGVAEVVEAIAQFFADLGEAVWEGLKAAYCYLFGCPESGPPPKPLDQEIYEVYFVPRLSDGLNAIEAVDPYALNKLCEDIKNGAIDKFKATAKAMYTPEYWPIALQQYTDATKTAAKKFTELVVANWSADIVQKVLPDLGQKRSQFNGGTEIGLHVLGAAQAYEASQWTWNENDPGGFVTNNCTSTFTDSFKFAHVDRWISKNHDKANTLKAIPNYTWCSEIFWKSNQLQFADRFRYYMTKGTGWCQEAGQTIVCDTVAHYQECGVLLGSVGQKDQCSVNVATTGKQVAQEIDAYFKAQGSKIPCQYGVIDFSKGGTGNKPVDFICTRPTQGNACKKYYDDHFGTLPVKVLNCVVNETAEYTNLKNRVKYVVEMLKKGGNIHPSEKQQTIASKAADAKVKQAEKLGYKTTSADETKKSAVPSTQGTAVSVFHPPCDAKLEVPSPSLYHDPLIVVGAECIVEKVKSDPDQNFGFGPPSSKPGFDYDAHNVNPIDGASTPVLNELSNIDKGVLGKIIKDKSMTTVTPESKLKDILESGGTPPKPEPGDKFPTGKGEIVTSPTAAQAKITGVEIAGAQTETKPMSGTLPTGSRPETGISGGQTSTPFSLTLLPDITSNDQVKVAGMPVAWAGTLTVDANQAASRNKNNSGFCEFQIEYSVRNIGKAPTGSFRSLWTNSAVTGSWTRVWTPIAAGSVKSEKDLVPLKPGRNQLQLVLDDLHQVQESNEANNTFSLTINVTGSCGAATGITPPAGTPLRR